MQATVLSGGKVPAAEGAHAAGRGRWYWDGQRQWSEPTRLRRVRGLAEVGRGRQFLDHAARLWVGVDPARLGLIEASVASTRPLLARPDPEGCHVGESRPAAGTRQPPLVRRATATGVTVVVPTMNEAGSVPELVARLGEALPADGTHEVLFVDDSTDDTPAVLRGLAAESELPIRVLHRETPAGGLGGAVVAGLREPGGTWVVVMDGNIQHPPALVPRLVEAGDAAGADLVVASRYANGGSRSGLANAYRRLVSQSSTTLTRAAFPRRLAKVSDPMSGFFAVRRSAVSVEDLRPIGFTILLELIVRCRIAETVDVPFEFRERFAGESKFSLREGARLLRHLCALRVGSSPTMRMLGFGAVGLSGFVPNLGVLWLLHERLAMNYLLAAVLSTQVAILWNFVLLDVLVFTEARRWWLGGRLASFVALNNVDLVARIPMLAVLVEQLRIDVIPAAALTVLGSFAFRFLVTDRMIYVRRR
jgi:dolichol-phosphate mannosyltransferase